jgi:hypothetical protein
MDWTTRDAIKIKLHACNVNKDGFSLSTSWKALIIHNLKKWNKVHSNKDHVVHLDLALHCTSTDKKFSRRPEKTTFISPPP